MHFLTALIIVFGFVFVFCLGLVKVVWDLSEMNVHAAPDALSTIQFGDSGAKERRANAPESYESTFSGN
jgi:hypothetical protein